MENCEIIPKFPQQISRGKHERESLMKLLMAPPKRSLRNGDERGE